MALRPFFTCNLKPHDRTCSPEMPPRLIQPRRRESVLMATVASILLANETTFHTQTAHGFELKMTAPEQTLEEAESGVREHAQALLEVKDLIEAESWREAQKALRKRSSFLKQDMYTIIQAKPGNQRPQLRKLYSDLFNNVSRLDYAARDEDASGVWQCYENIVLALNDILSRI
ncbi:hypothetical protein SLA2020_305970 [Shorea laevis]